MKKVKVSDRARKDLGSVDDLRKSIIEHTLISPISVAPEKDGLYQLVAGGRRFEAFSLVADWIPAVIVMTFEGREALDLKERELEENLHRKDLNWAEESKLMLEITEIKKKLYGDAWSSTNTAVLLGKDPRTVQKNIELTRIMGTFSQEVQASLRNKPKAVALREIERVVKGQEAAAKVASGAITIKGVIVNKGALEFIQEVPLGSVSLALTDPPYGTPVLPSDAVITGNSAMPIKTQIRPHDNMTQDAVRALLSELYPKVYNALKPGGWFLQFFSFNNYHWLVTMLQLSGFVVDLDPLIWDKVKPAQPVGGMSFLNSYEPILVAYKPPAKSMNTNLRNVLPFPKVPATKRLHPFQKPKELLETLITALTHKGDIVMDLFAGSGSTILAATSLERNGIGCEIDEENWKAAMINLSPVES